MPKADMPQSHATAPPAIFLVIEDGDEDEPFSDSVAWCQDRIYDADIPYIRYDQAGKMMVTQLASGARAGAAAILTSMASMLTSKSWHALWFRIMLAIAPTKAFNVLKKQVLDTKIELLEESLRPSNNPMP
jgi:hypothetical protein